MQRGPVGTIRERPQPTGPGMLFAGGWTFPVLRDSSMELARTSGQQEGQGLSVLQGAMGFRPGRSAV